jgi:hypothetical protein
VMLDRNVDLFRSGWAIWRSGGINSAFRKM